jgi:hypothetical protein
MPKRTNDFQSLIKRIYEQIVPEGGTVTESGMVYDKDAGILREVDILVKYKYAGHEFSFMVECRGRSRKDTVEWIDGLIGKSKSLAVNKVVAVSSKGFAASAIAKARANGIETFTLEKANETHWCEFPFKPGIALMSPEVYRISDVQYKIGDEYISMAQLDDQSVLVSRGEKVDTLINLVRWFFQEVVVPEIDKYKKEHIAELFKTREDVEKELRCEREYVWPEATVLDKNGNPVTFSVVKFFVKGTRKTKEVEQEHKVFNNKTVSIGKHMEDDGTTIEFRVVQDPDTRKVHLSFDKKKAVVEKKKVVTKNNEIKEKPATKKILTGKKAKGGSIK